MLVTTSIEMKIGIHLLVASDDNLLVCLAFNNSHTCHAHDGDWADARAALHAGSTCRVSKSITAA